VTIELYTEVVLLKDVPEEDLRAGDVGTLVECLAGVDGEEGCMLEVFNGLGETLKVAIVPASAVRAVSAHDLWTVRPLAGTH
jgi:hypothetical protein